MFEEFLFRGEVGVQEGDEDDCEGEDGHPDGLAGYEAAEHRAHHRADGEEEQHARVARPLFAVGLVRASAVVQLLGEADADLADVVGDEGRGHGDALGLAEGVILHGGEEVYDDLGYLHRRGIGDAAQDQHRGHFNEYEHGVPAHKKAVLYRIGEQLGDK